MKHNFWDRFIIEGTEDYVGLWQIIKKIRLNRTDKNQKEVQSITLDAIREILETGFMQIGMFEYVDEKSLEYQVWNLDINTCIQRVEKEWNELGREPNIGEVAWLVTTEKGEKEAKIILKEREEA